MPDITMCDNENCVDSMTCERFCAEPSEYHQSYCRFDPDLNGNCEHYRPWDESSPYFSKEN